MQFWVEWEALTPHSTEKMGEETLHMLGKTVKALLSVGPSTFISILEEFPFKL